MFLIIPTFFWIIFPICLKNRGCGSGRGELAVKESSTVRLVTRSKADFMMINIMVSGKMQILSFVHKIVKNVQIKRPE